LRASDGRWNQDVSLFAKVLYGNPQDVVGKIVEIGKHQELIAKGGLYYNLIQLQELGS